MHPATTDSLPTNEHLLRAGAFPQRFEPIHAALLTIPEVARYCAISRSGAYRAILPYVQKVQIGGRVLVTRESLDAFIAERARPAQAQAA
jgi:predicted DNA-binding transcriptional regulator AlpA